jgi:hypothetical protein
MEFTLFFNETRFSRVKSMLMGHVPTVNTVGILTAQNPQGDDFTNQQKDRHQNNNFNQQLFQDLKNSNYGPIRVQGKYGGNKERSFLVPNIQRDEAIALARKYSQESVIWGSKQQDVGGQPYMEFEWIEDGVTTQTRTISISNAEIQNRNDYYSQVGNVKFAIPFFDDDYEDQGKVVKIGQPDPNRYRKAEERLPYVDDLFVEKLI